MSYLQWDENKRRRLALAEKEASTKLILYPNPAKDRLMVSHPNLLVETAQVQISDINGRIVLQATLESTGIDISELKNGLYFISIGGAERHYSGRFVKQ